MSMVQLLGKAISIFFLTIPDTETIIQKNPFASRTFKQWPYLVSLSKWPLVPTGILVQIIFSEFVHNQNSIEKLQRAKSSCVNMLQRLNITGCHYCWRWFYQSSCDQSNLQRWLLVIWLCYFRLNIEVVLAFNDDISYVECLKHISLRFCTFVRP